MATAIPRLDAPAAALVGLLLTAPAAADAPQLQLPVDCRPGVDCFVQNYVDVDPGPAMRDFSCGPLTYDGHRGTDIRLLDRAAMRRGVAVLAAAAGTVLSARDGEADAGRGFDPAVAGRECGNGVRLDHGGGWVTQYCHLMQGSVAVRPGAAVSAGQPLGRIGLSGASEFPHLHLTVLHRDRVVDPFTGRAGDNLACEADPSRGLWAPAAAAALTYRASGLLGAGFASQVPDKAGLAEGLFHAAALPADAPALLFWARIFGLRAGDVQALRLTGPDGVVLAEASATAEKPLAVAYRYVGRRLTPPRWPAGRYVGRYTLSRAGAMVLEVEKVLAMP